MDKYNQTRYAFEYSAFPIKFDINQYNQNRYLIY